MTRPWRITSREFKASDRSAWSRDVLAADGAAGSSALQRLRTIVCHLLYAGGLTERRVGPPLGPPLAAWRIMI